MKEFFKKYWRELVMLLFLIAIIALTITTGSIKEEKNRWENNYYTAIDSINVITTKNNELIYERDNYKLEYDELNKKQQDKVKELERELNKQITYISKLEGNIKIDTVVIKDSVYIKDDITYIDFKYRDDWFKIHGITKLDKDTTTTINNLYMDVPLVLGMTQKGDLSSVFVTTPNPYITFSNIEGAELNNTPKSFKHWVWTAEFGVDIQYGLLHNNLDAVPRIQTDIKYIFRNNINVGARIGLNTQTSTLKTDIFPYAGFYVGYGIRF
jgi:hypothetical protein